ncbi:MAG: GTP cyclohydrolase I [Polyangiaceae bacterium]
MSSPPPDRPERPDRQAVARAVEAFLLALGHRAEGPLAETPALVAEAWCDELLDGEGVDPAALLAAGAIELAPDQTSELVCLRDLAVSSMCPHHLLPSLGHADVIYRPAARVAGLGTIAQALRAATRRLILQEEAGALAAQSLVVGLGAHGALCRLRMTHSCLSARGAREHAARVETLSVAGSFAAGGADRALALAALGGGEAG